jgi:hypothetical protein
VRKERVLETLVFSPLKHLAQLVAPEDFIILIHRESSRLRVIKLWYACHQWYASHCTEVHGLSERKYKDKKIKIKPRLTHHMHTHKQ